MRTVLFGLLLVAGNASASVVTWDCSATMTVPVYEEGPPAFSKITDVSGPPCDKSDTVYSYFEYPSNYGDAHITVSYSSFLTQDADSFTLTTNLYGSLSVRHILDPNPRYGGGMDATYLIEGLDSIKVDRVYDYWIDDAYMGKLHPGGAYDWSSSLTDSLFVAAQPGQTATDSRNMSLTRTIRAVQVPEPGTLALLSLGLVGVGLIRRSKVLTSRIR